MPDLATVVVPARNEAATIGRVVQILSDVEGVDEIIVVDNGSSDDTRAVAAAAGARTLREPVAGMGHAVKAGLAAARNDWVLKIDADLESFDTRRIAGMLAARAPGVGLVKGAWNDPADNMPMTRLLVMPAIKTLAPGLAALRAPNSGIYLVDRAHIAHHELTGDYAVDLDVMLRVHASGAAVREVDIGRISHDPRSVGHYNAMAETIMAFFMKVRDRRPDHEVAVLARRADQVVVNALGLVADRARAGARVSVYLAEPHGAAADVLSAALAPFPTVRIAALQAAGAFAPSPPARHLCVIAPFPAADDDDAIRTALALRDKVKETRETDLLLMPLRPNRAGTLGSFRADTAVDTSRGAVIKQNAFDVLGLAPAPLAPAPAASRETFQTYESLPQALKPALDPASARPAAGNL